MNKVTFAQSCATATAASGSSPSMSSQPISFNVNKISMELDRCTKELHKLEEELENAAKQTCSAHANFVSSAGGQPDLATLTKDVNQNLNISDQQIINTYESQDELKLRDAQRHKDASDLRLKDSKSHVDKIEKMLHLLEEVQVTKKSGDERLQKTEEEALLLNRKIKSLETFLKECHRPCCVHCQHSSGFENSDEQRPLLDLPAERDFKNDSEVKLPQKHKLVSKTNPLDSIFFLYIPYYKNLKFMFQ